MNLSRPLVCLDIESTGPRPDTDRIVELALVVLRPDGSRTRHRWLVNPGCPIPADATAVHGITDEHVAAAPSFDMIAYEVAEALTDVDLTGYNLRAFDLPLLRAELDRSGFAWPCDGARVVDSFVIFRERERHTLSTAVRRYCGRDLVGAHGAVADAEAALDVLLAQLGTYPDLAAMDLVALDIESGGQRPDWATPCGKVRWGDDGEAVIAFGKHNGRRLADVERGFLAWVMRSEFPADVKGLVARAMRGERVRRPAPPVPISDLRFDDIPF